MQEYKEELLNRIQKLYFLINSVQNVTIKDFWTDRLLKAKNDLQNLSE
jgi:hypothetical protein